MSKFYYPAIIAFFITACASSPPASNVELSAANKTANANASTSPTIKPTADLPTDQANTNSAVNAQNSINSNQPRLRDTSVSLENMERLRSKGGGDRNAAPIPATKPTPFAAPDNSEIAVTMNRRGVPIETRIFKNNPRLAKVERTFEDGSNPVTKVYLKNGKVLMVPKGAISNSATATAAEYLRAVGVEP